MKTYLKGESIYRQEEPAGCWYLLKSGQVELVDYAVFDPQESFRDVIVDVLDAEQIFGLEEYLCDRPRILTARCLTECSVEAHEGVCPEIVVAVAERALTLTGRLVDASRLEVYGRLRKLLSGYNGSGCRMTHQRMSEMLGCSREMVSITMKTLKDGGFIGKKGKSYHVLKPLPERW